MNALPAPGLRALLQDSLDYAGLFPPASLPLESALRNYAGYRQGPDAWLLGRFVCPAERLPEVDSYRSLFSDAAPLVSALGLPIPASTTRVDAIELRLVEWQDQAVICEGIRAAAETIEQSELTEATPYFEVTAKERWREAACTTLDAMAEHNATWQGQRSRPAAFKLRTGGLTTDTFPTVGQLAFVITACQERGVKFKCTAGLHHPIRHYDESVGTKVHGFLNVFVAAVLARAHSVRDADLEPILADEVGPHFEFDEGGFSWQGLKATLGDISAARQELISAFGSCSVDEPLEDLRHLGLLPTGRA